MIRSFFCLHREVETKPHFSAVKVERNATAATKIFNELQF
ncbi:hypothetical protein ACVWXS_002652 [Lysinibacillus sp. TE18511]